MARRIAAALLFIFPALLPALTKRPKDACGAARLYHPTGFPLFCSSSHFCSGAK